MTWPMGTPLQRMLCESKRGLKDTESFILRAGLNGQLSDPNVQETVKTDSALL